MITCPDDGTEHPAIARFCMLCGRPFDAGAAAREYRTASVPLGLPIPDRESLDADDAFAEYTRRYDAAVASFLAKERAEGWEPDEAVDLDSAAAARRLRLGAHLMSGVDTLLAVSIRLRRAARAGA